MTLIKPSDLILQPPPDHRPQETRSLSFNRAVIRQAVSDQEKSLTQTIGLLDHDAEKHYYSHGNFNLMRLVFHLLKQTGPADILLTTYSISQRTLEGVEQRIQNGSIASIRFIIDNRVRVMSPIPFQFLKENFTYRCISLHAKVALIENQDWKISIITSQNATDNPKLERGVIYTIPEVFDFDKTILENEFDRGTA